MVRRALPVRGCESPYRWTRTDLPRKGWECVGTFDHVESESSFFRCEMCRNPLVRYVHVLNHPEHHEPIWVGCKCAAGLERDPKAPGRREREMRKKAKQAAIAKHLMLQRAWRMLANGLSDLHVTRPWSLSEQGISLVAEFKRREPNYHVLARATVTKVDDIWRAGVEVCDAHTGRRLWIWLDPEEHCTAIMAQFACVDYITDCWPDDAVTRSNGAEESFTM